MPALETGIYALSEQCPSEVRHQPSGPIGFMTTESGSSHRRLPKVTLALPDGELRRRVLAVLEGSNVEIELLDADDLVQGVQEAEGDVVLVGPGQVEGDELDALGHVARDEDEAGVAVIGDADAGERARLLAAGFSGVLSAEQAEEDLAASLEALAAAEAEGGLSGPEVGGSGAQPRLADFLTRSPRMREFVDLVQRVIPADTTLLITGPTGVGKEHLARAIHAESPRSNGPFVAVNCAALPEQLLEAELFGHSKGAFTGADSERKGHFELADGGTVFLDEVGEMPLHLQAKLLTVLQRHEVTPVGSETPVRVNVRVVVATNRDLPQDVADGRFREDLYFRLNVVPLQIPALADRPEDIPDLVGRFIQHFRTAMPVSEVESISDAAVKALMSYAWPGNIRELINIVERAMLLGRGTEIVLGDLPAAVAHGAESVDRVAPTLDRGGDHGVPDDWLELPIKEVRDLAIKQAETAYLRAVLSKTQGHLAETAKIVGLSARALYEKMKRYDLKKEDFKPTADG